MDNWINSTFQRCTDSTIVTNQTLSALVQNVCLSFMIKLQSILKKTSILLLQIANPVNGTEIQFLVKNDQLVTSFRTQRCPGYSYLLPPSTRPALCRIYYLSFFFSKKVNPLNLESQNQVKNIQRTPIKKKQIGHNVRVL